MLLAIDIGNSTIGMGLYPDAEDGKKLLLRKLDVSSVKSSVLHESIPAALHELFAEHGKRLLPKKIGVVISSVVPKVDRVAKNAIKEFCKNKYITITDLLVVDYKVSGGLLFEVHNPETVGSDRIADAAAAFNLIGKPIVVADLGTATTISVVGRNGNFIGGAIMPGIDMMRESLASGTAKLPAVDLSTLRHITGRDTTSAIASGIINGTAGAIEKIITGIEHETCNKLRLILTGGRATLVSPYLKKKHIIMPHLIFEGMRLIYMRQAGHVEN